MAVRRTTLCVGEATEKALSVSFRLVVTLAMVAAAAVVGLALLDYYKEAHCARDGRVRADVVEVAPSVSGLVIEVPRR